MALIEVGDVQSWFTEDRLQLEYSDELPEETNVSNEVLAKISKRYDVTLWVSVTTTPALVKSVISAQVAAIRYRKQYADQLADEVNNYADWLDNWAMTTLDGIVDGSIPLLDIVTDEELVIAQESASASFYPTDAEIDGDAAKFTMDMSW